MTAPILHCSHQVKPLRRDAKRHQQGPGYLQPDRYGKDRSIATNKISGGVSFVRVFALPAQRTYLFLTLLHSTRLHRQFPAKAWFHSATYFTDGSRLLLTNEHGGYSRSRDPVAVQRFFPEAEDLAELLEMSRPIVQRLISMGKEPAPLMSADGLVARMEADHERIAEAAQCARSTVYEAIRALEDAGLLTWVNRIKRVRERCVDLLGDRGWRWRVLRTSNAYTFRDPSPSAERPNSSKSEKPTGTENPVLSSDLLAALDRLAARGRVAACGRLLRHGRPVLHVHHIISITMAALARPAP